MFLTNLRVGRRHSISFCFKFHFSYVLSKVFRLALFVLSGELLRNTLNRNTFACFLSIVTYAHIASESRHKQKSPERIYRKDCNPNGAIIMLKISSKQILVKFFRFIIYTLKIFSLYWQTIFPNANLIMMPVQTGCCKARHRSRPFRAILRAFRFR